MLTHAIFSSTPILTLIWTYSPTIVAFSPTVYIWRLENLIRVISLNTSIFHLNIRSLKKHWDEYISTLDFPFPPLESQKHGLTNHTDLFDIPGYNFISHNRHHKSGGGVGLLINSNLSFKPCLDLQSLDSQIYESVFVEIVQENRKIIIVGCVYKTPDTSVDEFNSCLSNAKISYEGKLAYLMGDYNINRLNSGSHKPTNDFVNLMSSNGLYPLNLKTH